VQHGGVVWQVRVGRAPARHGGVVWQVRVGRALAQHDGVVWLGRGKADATWGVVALYQGATRAMSATGY
jgi:hypothetical protein